MKNKQTNKNKQMQNQFFLNFMTGDGCLFWLELCVIFIKCIPWLK